MTVLSPSKLFKSSRQQLWNVIAEMSHAQSWIEGLAQAEFLRGNPDGLGGVWRFHCKWNSASHVFDFEITEWIKGYRVGVRPSRQTAVVGSVQYFQFVLDLKEVAPRETLVEIEFNYEPLSKLTRLKNVTYLRRQYLDFINRILDRLERVVAADTAA